jgi:hypothetical protein
MNDIRTNWNRISSVSITRKYIQGWQAFILKGVNMSQLGQVPSTSAGGQEDG